MCREEFGGGHHDVLEIWKLTPAGITKLCRWIPHEKKQGDKRDIYWARYLSADELVTASNDTLTVWDVATAQPRYWLKIRGVPALSPDRHRVAFATDNDIGILDVATGEVVATMPMPERRRSSRSAIGDPLSFAFTPKGTRLVAGTHDRVFVWDMSTGRTYREISLSGTGPWYKRNVLCPSEEHILIGNSLLIDIETQAKLWTYTGPRTGRHVGRSLLV